MTLDEMSGILEGISLGKVLYPHGYRWRLLTKGDGFLLQLVYLEADTSAGPVNMESPLCDQYARKWYVSSHSTETEVVRTAWKAVMASLEHRLGEHFRYHGVQVYSPHHDISELRRLAELKKDGRDSP